METLFGWIIILTVTGFFASVTFSIISWESQKRKISKSVDDVLDATKRLDSSSRKK